MSLWSMEDNTSKDNDSFIQYFPREIVIREEFGESNSAIKEWLKLSRISSKRQTQEFKMYAMYLNL